MKFNPRQLLAIVAAVVIVAAAVVWFLASRQNNDVLQASTDAATPPAATTTTTAPVATAPATTTASDTTAPAATTDPAPAAGQTGLMMPGPLGDMALGDPKAPNVVIEYASMTCSHCKRFHAEVYRPFKAKYIDTGKVYFIFRDYPLDPLAAAATVIAHCAPKERFFPLVDLMFDHQEEWAFVQNPGDALLNLVKQAGFTEESFRACLTNQKLRDGVDWVHDRAAKEFGVASTPTFFVNGKIMTGEQTLEDMDKALGG